MNFKIYCPSYKRAKTCNTQNVIEDVTFVVRKSEEEEYKNNGIKDIISVEDELINSGQKVVKWIIENAKEDVICIVDDDIKKYIYRLDTNEDIDDKEIVMCELERIAQIMYDLDIGFGATDNNPTPYNYCQEIVWKAIPGSTKFFNLKKYKAKIDSSVPNNTDVDIVLQELLTNRICFFQKYFLSKAEMDTNEGGDSNKTRKQQLDSILNMKKKWGKYFSYDHKHNKPRINVKR